MSRVLINIRAMWGWHLTKTLQIFRNVESEKCGQNIIELSNASITNKCKIKEKS